MQEDILKAKPGTVRVYSGRYINIADLKEEDICIEDIAHALAFKPRFNGNCKMFYSIAAHSISVATQLPKYKSLAGLLHDASEAYLFDIPAPYKLLGEFATLVELEKRVQDLIYKKYVTPICDFTSADYYEVKLADMVELNREWELAVLDSYLTSDPIADKLRFIKSFIDYCGSLTKDNDTIERTSNIRSEINYLKQKYNIR